MNINLEELFLDLYRRQFIQTLWNAEKKDNREQGWRLKNFMLVPWFFNMRPIGDAPLTFQAICKLMAKMISEHDINLLVGVEMAGVPLIGGICLELLSLGCPVRRFAYTRPLPEKVRHPGDLQRYVENYGQKDWVEGRVHQGDRCAIVDDMATNLSSKIIARCLVLLKAEDCAVQAECDKIFYFLDRGSGNRQRGLDFANEPDQSLKPAPLDVNFIVSFDAYLPYLEKVMTDNELQVITEHQKDSERFAYDEKWREEVLAMAKKESKVA
jgi:orotate phosphoribosyltransferase